MVAKLENEFIKACKELHGKLERNNYLIECDLSKKRKTHLLLGLNLQIGNNLPDLKIVTGSSYAELRFVENISVEPQRIVFIGEDKTVANVYPYNGVVYFESYGKKISGQLASSPRDLYRRRK